MWERLCALSEATEPGRISIKTAKRLRDCVAHGKRTSELSGEELEAAWKAGASSSAHRSLPSRWVRKASCCASLSAERHKLEPMGVLEEGLVEPRRARGAEDRVALRREDGCDVVGRWHAGRLCGPRQRRQMGSVLGRSEPRLDFPAVLGLGDAPAMNAWAVGRWAAVSRK